MRDLGTLGGDYSQGVAINPRGEIAGFSNTALGGVGDPHPFLWDGTMMLDLGTLGGVDGQAAAVNEQGEVVGQSGVAPFGSCTAPGGCHAFFWDGSIHDLGTLGGPSSAALALNTRGQVVGWSKTAGDDIHAVIWDVRP